jgi:hypothetical protein
MSRRRCLRCEEGEMALLGGATISVLGERDPPRLGVSEARNETGDFLFRIYLCPDCGYVELSK